jgi:hypothetical protein
LLKRLAGAIPCLDNNRRFTLDNKFGSFIGFIIFYFKDKYVGVSEQCQR